MTGSAFTPSFLPSYLQIFILGMFFLDSDCVGDFDGGGSANYGAKGHSKCIQTFSMHITYTPVYVRVYVYVLCVCVYTYT